MRLRLLKKFAEKIDGIDLRGHASGDTVELPRPEARLLIAEGWAVREEARRSVSGASHPTAVARDRPKRRHG